MPDAPPAPSAPPSTTATSSAPPAASPTSTATPNAAPASDPGVAAGAAAEVPAWAKGVPEKLRGATPEETIAKLAASYTGLEGKLGALPAMEQELTRLRAASPLPTLADLPDDATVAAINERAGVKEEEIAAAWAKDGRLTDEQYRAYKDKAGIPRSIVDAQIRGRLAEAALAARQADDMLAKAHALSGGSHQWDQLKAFAKGNLPPARLQDLDARLKDPARFEAAVHEIIGEHKRHLGASGAFPLIASDGTAAAPSGFSTAREMHNAMKASKAKHGAWENDPQFMARYAQTPHNVRTSPI